MGANEEFVRPKNVPIVYLHAVRGNKVHGHEKIAKQGQNIEKATKTRT